LIFGSTPIERNERHQSIDTTIVFISGIIQSTGPEVYYQERFNLKQAAYQIVTDSGGYFLEGSQDFSDYWGSCVEITGATRIISDSIKLRDHFLGRQVLEVSSIKYSDVRICPNQWGAEENEAKAYVQKYYPHAKLETFSGSLERSTRPFVDITYDYQLSLDKPFWDTCCESEDSTEFKSIVVSCSNYAMYMDYERFIKDTIQVEISGYRLSGYQHSLLIHTLTVKEK